MPSLVYPFNRTSVELKRATAAAIGDTTLLTFNRTSVELKLGWAGVGVSTGLTF